jgi:hypothetical protein
VTIGSIALNEIKTMTVDKESVGGKKMEIVEL